MGNPTARFEEIEELFLIALYQIHLAYAHELASVVVWIGYLQWLNDNAMGWPTEPILRKLDNIQHRDAILACDAEGNQIEPEWPDAEFIIGKTLIQRLEKQPAMKNG